MMTKIKFCGLTRPCDIEAANEIKPDYIGFVFAPKSKRRVSYKQAVDLKNLLSKDIKAVGVFLNEDIDQVISLLNLGIIDAAQPTSGGFNRKPESRSSRRFRSTAKRMCPPPSKRMPITSFWTRARAKEKPLTGA